MTTHIIHPASSGTLRFRCDRPHRISNANSIGLIFESDTYRGDLDATEIVAFRLCDADAEILSTVGLLDAEHREQLLPILRHLMDDQTADAVVALEEATA